MRAGCVVIVACFSCQLDVDVDVLPVTLVHCRSPACPLIRLPAAHRTPVLNSVYYLSCGTSSKLSVHPINQTGLAAAGLVPRPCALVLAADVGTMITVCPARPAGSPIVSSCPVRLNRNIGCYS